MPSIFSSKNSSRKASKDNSNAYAESAYTTDNDSVYSYNPKQETRYQQSPSQSRKPSASSTSSKHTVTPEELAKFQTMSMRNTFQIQ